MKLINVAAGLALGIPFAFLGYEAVAEPGVRVGMATKFGIPEEYAETAVRINGAVMALGGVSVATGILPRLGALGVAASMVPTTLAGHAFWNDTDPTTKALNRIQFMKNLGLIGGMLAIAGRRGKCGCRRD
ncbi:MAG: DoxX family protein [Brooklawnia sp.]